MLENATRLFLLSIGLVFVEKWIHFLLGMIHFFFFSTEGKDYLRKLDFIDNLMKYWSHLYCNCSIQGFNSIHTVFDPTLPVRMPFNSHIYAYHKSGSLGFNATNILWVF